MSAELDCRERNGPNCSSCICKLTGGHDGDHENWHGTKWGGPAPTAHQQMDDLRARLTSAEAALRQATAALERIAHDQTFDLTVCAMASEALANLQRAQS